jgi:hypothetical protein
VAVAAVLWPALTAAAEIANYSPVTAQRLTNPEPGNWMLYRRTYDGQGYSPLDKINTANVKSLVPVWTFSTGVLEGHEAPPIVNNGIMFVATPMNQVIALDGEITFKKGRVEQGNFDSYQVLRIDQSPPVTQVHIVPNGIDVASSGVGEPGLPPFAPALCNAIFAATGKRIRRLPIGNQLAT